MFYFGMLFFKQFYTNKCVYLTSIASYLRHTTYSSPMNLDIMMNYNSNKTHKFKIFNNFFK